MTYASDAVDQTFAEFGHAATYTAIDGNPAPCTIIVDLRDAGSRPDDGRPIAGQITIEVRLSEIAAPAQGGIFSFSVNGAARSATVMNRPQLDDEEGLVWKMWAT